MRAIVPVLIFWCVILCGCAARRPIGGITYFVGEHCHPTAYEMGCDQNSPPNCKQIALRYDKQCEQIVAVKK